MKKRALPIFLIAMLAVAFVVPSISAQSTPVPSVPTFSLTYIDHSFDAPAATVDDGYIGPHYVPAHHVRNGTILVTINNQPFTQYKDANNHTIELFYHIRCKGHYDSSWITYPDTDDYIQTSNSQTTVFSYGMNEEWAGTPGGRVPNLTQDGKLDFQVETFIGYSQTVCTSIARRADDYYTYFTGQKSGWSNTQTISMPSGEVSFPAPEVTNAPINAPTFPPLHIDIPNQAPAIISIQTSSSFTVFCNFDLAPIAAVLLVGVVAVLLVFVLFYLRKVPAN